MDNPRARAGRRKGRKGWTAGIGVACVGLLVALTGGAGGAMAATSQSLSHRDPLAHPSPNGKRPPAASPWSSLAASFPGSAGPYMNMLLLTDGTVLVQEFASNDWYRLTPNDQGSYINGTWSTNPLAMPSDYGPYYDASAVLPNGEAIIEGGEDNFNKGAETNLGAIFNPDADNGAGAWTAVNPPSGWTQIGDSPSVVLGDGQFMLGNLDNTDDAFFNPANQTWRTTTGPGKADNNSEEGWSLLPDGQVLTVDTEDGNNTELYTPSTGTWTSAGSTPDPLWAYPGCNCVNEVGPQVTLPNGTVLATGASGYNAYYTESSGKWSAGPSFPVIDGTQYDISDGPAAVLPDGDALVAASPGPDQNKTPEHFFLIDGSSLTQIADAPNDSSVISWQTSMLVLPTGQVLVDNNGSLYVYSGGGTPNSAWEPKITNIPGTVQPGGTYTVTGTQLDGLSQGSAYGDDFQDSTNYPLVRIDNNATGNQVYARTFSRSFNGGTISIAAGAKSSWRFRVPTNIGAGTSTVHVIANGIASPGITITVG